MSSTGVTGPVGAAYDPSHHFRGHSEPPPSRPADPVSEAIKEVSRRSRQVGELQGVIDRLLEYVDDLEKALINDSIFWPEKPKAVERARLLLERGDG